MGLMAATRENEWYALKRGPKKLRAFVNMTFFPYTLMNAGYVVIGSTLAPTVHWDRALVIVLVYLLAVGISAHALDAMGPNKPWGQFMSRRQLFVLSLAALVPALPLGIFEAVTYAPLLLVIGVAELFLLFAYNLELFGSRFHSKAWFAFSWGFLPVLAGYSLQTNAVGLISLAGGLFGFATAYIEATASRPYKLLKKAGVAGGSEEAARFERILKGIVSCVLSVTSLLVLIRLV